MALDFACGVECCHDFHFIDLGSRIQLANIVVYRLLHYIEPPLSTIPPKVKSLWALGGGGVARGPRPAC